MKVYFNKSYHATHDVIPNLIWNLEYIERPKGAKLNWIPNQVWNDAPLGFGEMLWLY